MLQNKAPSKAKWKPVLNQGLCTADSCLILFSFLKKDEKQGRGKGTLQNEKEPSPLKKKEGKETQQEYLFWDYDAIQGTDCYCSVHTHTGWFGLSHFTFHHLANLSVTLVNYNDLCLRIVWEWMTACLQKFL